MRHLRGVASIAATASLVAGISACGLLPDSADVSRAEAAELFGAVQIPEAFRGYVLTRARSSTLFELGQKSHSLVWQDPEGQAVHAVLDLGMGEAARWVEGLRESPPGNYEFVVVEGADALTVASADLEAIKAIVAILRPGLDVT